MLGTFITVSCVHVCACSSLALAPQYIPRMLCSTFKCLLYANVAVHKHFKMLIARYHRVSHRSGRVCVRDRYILRKMTVCLKEDAQVKRTFAALANPVSFRSEDLDKVFLKYLDRVETMIGNEIASQLMRDLRIREVDT